jgi:Lantibiotic dehydratase, N terminus
VLLSYGVEWSLALASSPATAVVGARLLDAPAGLAAIDAGGVGASPEAYRRLAGHPAGLPASPEPSQIVQLDLIKPPVEAALGAGVVGDIARGVQVLHSLSGQPVDTALASFREQFTRGYETRELPLAQVLDDETGSGLRTAGQGTAAGPDPRRAGHAPGRGVLRRRVERAAPREIHGSPARPDRRPAWVIDGNYNSTLEIRLRTCDTVLFTDVPALTALRGVLARQARH